MIKLTEKAVQKIKEFAEAEGIPASVRLLVRGGGCAGFKNDMYFDEISSEADEILQQDGVKILIDAMSFQYLDNSTVDYVKGEYSEGFSFSNPNVQSSCGCGSSVSY